MVSRERTGSISGRRLSGNDGVKRFAQGGSSGPAGDVYYDAGRLGGAQHIGTGSPPRKSSVTRRPDS